MSAKFAGLCWELDLPHEQMLVLQAMADHADHEGGSVFPSLRLIAWKTGYSERQVRRIVDALEAVNVLVAVSREEGHATEYRIDLNAIPRKAPFNSHRGRPRAVNPPKNPCQNGKNGCSSDTRLPEKPLTSEQKTPDTLTKTGDISARPHIGNARRTEPSLEPSGKEEEPLSHKNETAPKGAESVAASPDDLVLSSPQDLTKKPSRRRKPEPCPIPSRADVDAFFQAKGVPQLAEDFWDMEEQRGWTQGAQQLPLISWTAAANRYIRDPNGFRRTKPDQPPPEEEVRAARARAETEARIRATQDEMERQRQEMLAKARTGGVLKPLPRLRS